MSCDKLKRTNLSIIFKIYPLHRWRERETSATHPLLSVAPASSVVGGNRYEQKAYTTSGLKIYH